MNNRKITLISLVLSVWLSLSSFVFVDFKNDKPVSISRSMDTDRNGKEIIITEITLDKTTSREDLIHSCSFLAKENVQLTFESLIIGKSIFGLVGKQRITYAKGKITLLDGSFHQFEVGRILNFKSIKITYSRNKENDDLSLDMVEIKG